MNNHSEKRHYVYKINKNGEVCYFFDLTLLKFHLLSTSRNNAIITIKKVRNNKKTHKELKYLFSKKKYSFLLKLFEKFNFCVNTLSFFFKLFSIIEFYFTIVYNNYYINRILFLDLYNNSNLLLLSNIFFNF